MGSLRDRVVLLTGGSSGIGRAAVFAFARAGAKVVLAARGTERAEEVAEGVRNQGGEALFVKADVSRAEDVERLVDKTVAAYGPLYSAAKAGVLALTKSAAREYATKGIRVFEVAGGGTADGSKAVEEQYTALVPMRRIGSLDEAATAAIWLCSDASSYVTGQSMIVDGGMTSPTR